MYVNSALGFPGSIPQYVMSTGNIAVFNPMDARQDIRPGSVERITHLPVAQPPGSAGYGPPPLPPYSEATVPSPAATAGFGADGGDNSVWAWGLVAVLAAAAGLGAYKAVRG
jgi:hypothetical protein